MKYLLLSYAEASADRTALAAEARDYEAALRDGGHDVDYHILQAAESAAIVRHRQGRTTVTEGPFAEKRLQLGGLVLIEASDLNEAIQIASKLPTARHGCVEVRPVQD